MRVKKVDLPKKYEYKEGVSPKKYKKFHGRQKISYSQHTSWKEGTYRGSYIAGYFMGIEDKGNIFSDFGTFCGEYIETQGKELGELSEKDMDILDTLKHPKNSLYEDEIVIDLKPFGIDAVMQGFIDRSSKFGKNGVSIIDFKTGALKKEEFYASDEYQQTTVYCYAKEVEGISIKYSGVVLLPRKGNGSEKHPLRLEGEPIIIDTPYSTERANKALADVVKSALEISEAYKLYKRLV